MPQPASPPAPVPRALLPARATTADGTRRRLLEEALVLFGERGYHGVSVREIAAGAGIRASSLYAHVESKEQLLFELLYIGHEEHHELLRRALLEAGTDPREQIRGLVTAHVFMHATYPMLGRICNRELTALATPSHARVDAIREKTIQLFEDVIERGSRLEVFTVPDTWLVVAAIGAIGIRVAEWWRDDLGYRVEHVATTYAQYALRMLTPGPSEGDAAGESPHHLIAGTAANAG